MSEVSLYKGVAYRERRSHLFVVLLFVGLVRKLGERESNLGAQNRELYNLSANIFCYPLFTRLSGYSMTNR